jgi:large subunit ribosomal protein L33
MVDCVCSQNRKNTPDKLELLKYNKFLRRHTLHREIK